MAPPESTGTEHVPVYVAIDPLTNEVYVTDRPTGAIYIYYRDGVYQRTFTLAQPRPGWQPLGARFSTARGDLYVTDLFRLLPEDPRHRSCGDRIRTLGETSKLTFPNGCRRGTALATST